MFPIVAARNVNPGANAGSQPGHCMRSWAIHRNQDERLGECPSLRLVRQSLVEAACDWEQSSEIHNTLPIHLCGRTTTTCDGSATSLEWVNLCRPARAEGASARPPITAKVIAPQRLSESCQVQTHAPQQSHAGDEPYSRTSSASVSRESGIATPSNLGPFAVATPSDAASGTRVRD
jgi:hypothetical protein